jgi:hypothetical protein
MAFQPPAFDRQWLTERNPGLAAAVPADNCARLGGQPGIAVVLGPEEVGLRPPVLPAELLGPANDLRAVRVAAETADHRPAVELRRDEHVRKVLPPVRAAMSKVQISVSPRGYVAASAWARPSTVMMPRWSPPSTASRTRTSGAAAPGAPPGPHPAAWPQPPGHAFGLSLSIPGRKRGPDQRLHPPRRR